MDFLDFFRYGFIQRAVITGSFIAVLCSILGVFLVLRRFSLIGDGLSHVTFGSVALGLFLNIYPLYVSIPVVMISSVGILKLTERSIHADAAIGIVSSLGIATGIILASIAGGFNIDLFSYLFGNILSISRTETFIAVTMSIVVLSVISLFYNDILSVTFDEDYARVSGIRAERINMILVMLTAVTVVLAMKIVGIMLVSALIIFPPVTAFRLANGFKSTLIAALLIAELSVIIGISVSFIADLPTGATIIIINFLFLTSAFIYKKLKNRGSF